MGYLTVDGPIVNYHVNPQYQPDGTNADGFQQAIENAEYATIIAECTGNQDDINTANQDWGIVAGNMENQYRLAAQSSNPQAAYAKLDAQYAAYFQQQGGDPTLAGSLISDAKKEVLSETPDQIAAQLQLYQAESEPVSSSTRDEDVYIAAVAVTKADINAQLHHMFGNGNNGVYTASQVQQAAAVLDKADSQAAPLTDYVAATMEDSSKVTAKLYIIQHDPKSLHLTQAEQQLAKIDPVTLAFLLVDGITVKGTLSRQMVQLAKDSPSLFIYMEVNGVNITESTTTVSTTTGKQRYWLSDGHYLIITVNGQPLNLISSSPSEIAAVYDFFNGVNSGQGVDAVAQLLQPDLTINPKTLSKYQPLMELMVGTDSARAQYISDQLKLLMKNAPPATGSGAASYLAKTVNPFLTRQMNGFFTTDPQTVWDSTVQPILLPYVKAGLDAQFKNGIRSFNDAGSYLSQAVTGASPLEATMMINLVEGDVNAYKLNKNSLPPPHSILVSALGKAVQIADGDADHHRAPGDPSTGPEATQVANWLFSWQGGVLLNGAGANLYYDTAQGNYDLADAIVNKLQSGTFDIYKSNINLGGMIYDNVTRGEQDYLNPITQLIGKKTYDTVINNKTIQEMLFNKFAHMSGIGVTINVSDAAALRQAIINAYGFTADQLKDPNIQAIINLDIAWIKNQAGSNGTVTVLPYIYASPTGGLQNGVFFKVTNPHPPAAPVYHSGSHGGPVTVTYYQPPAKTVLIDGSAAQYALAEDPTAGDHPENVDVKWVYNDFQDFQLNNDLYRAEGGKIIRLQDDKLSLNADGNVSLTMDDSSATNVWRNIETGLDITFGGLALVGGFILAIPTDGASLALTAAGWGLTVTALGWGTYRAYEQYNDFTFHGEQFNWDNPNARGAILSDAMLATNWMSMGLGGTAKVFASAADATQELAYSAETLTEVADSATPVDDAATAALTPEELLAKARFYANVANVFAVTATPFGVGGQLLGTWQVGSTLYWTAANWDSLSASDKSMAFLNIAMSILPFFTEPIAESVDETVQSVKNHDYPSAQENPLPAGIIAESVDETVQSIENYDYPSAQEELFARIALDPNLKMPPTEDDFTALIEEHSRDKTSPPLTRAAADTMVLLTQPDGSSAIVVGGDFEGPDIYYHDLDINSGLVIGTVQVKSIQGWNGFKKNLSDELHSTGDEASGVIAFQVPDEIDVSKWMARYWGNMKSQTAEWTATSNPYLDRSVLIVNSKGEVLLPLQPVFNRPEG
jgi:hypothetical protein